VRSWRILPQALASSLHGETRTCRRGFKRFKGSRVQGFKRFKRFKGFKGFKVPAGVKAAMVAKKDKRA
jgi:hypothetical protein